MGIRSEYAKAFLQIAALTTLVVLNPAADAKDKKNEEGGIKVRLRKTIERTIKDVEKDNYAYGPKQDYDKETRYTHVYLPYGDNASLYAEVSGKFSGPEKGKVCSFHSNDGSSNALLTYKIEFNTTIHEFKFKSGRFEYNLNDDTAAGIEYSTNGRTWKTIKEIRGAETGDERILGSIVDDFHVKGLRAKKLYIRYYTRSFKKPEETWGGGRWLKLWLAGDPGWGDSATTFFIHQPQIWVK